MKKYSGKRLLSLMISRGYEVKVDFGKGLEAYEGCFHNLQMILEAPETETSEMAKEDNPDYWEDGKRLFKVENMFLPADLYFWVEK